MTFLFDHKMHLESPALAQKATFLWIKTTLAVHPANESEPSLSFLRVFSSAWPSGADNISSILMKVSFRASSMLLSDENFLFFLSSSPKYLAQYLATSQPPCPSKTANSDEFGVKVASLM